MTTRFSIKITLIGATCLSSLSGLFAGPVFAQSTDENTSTDSVEEVIVTAARRAQDPFKIAKSVSVLEAEDFIARQHVYVLDALQNVPGVAINQNGAFGGVATVSIRGNATDQTVILIDGVQVSDPSAPGGGFDFSTLDPNGIERVEVLRGPQAVLYGSDAIGGVINVITKSGGDGFGGSASAEYGAFDSKRFTGNIAGGGEAISYSLAGSYFDTDGISAADAADGNTEKDGYENLSLRAKLDAKASDTLRFQLATTYSDSENEFDGFAFVNGGFALADTEDSTESKEFNISGRAFLDALNGRLSNQISAEYSRIDRDSFTSGNFTRGAEGERLNFDYLANLTLQDGWLLTGGLQYEDIKAGSVDPEAIATASLFGMLSYEGNNGVTFSAGLRIDDHETFGSTTNGEVNASYVLSDSGTQIKAAWSEGFKAPSIFQLTFACCGFDANPNLNPETSNAWEVGLRQPLMNGKGSFEITYFNQRTNGLIQFTFTEGYQNLDRAKAKGLEIAFNTEITDTLSMSANYTLTNATDQVTGDRLIRRPKNQAFAGLNWQPLTGLKLAGALTYNGRESDTTGNVPGWVRVDLTASYRLSDQFELFGRINNLLDEDYQQVLGYGTPGASAFAGIRANF